MALAIHKMRLHWKKATAMQCGMDTAKQLEAEIAAFCAKHSMSGSTFSKLATGDAAFWFRFTRGRSPTIATYDKVRAFMADYKP